MASAFEHMIDLIRRDQRFAIATVVATQGSTPQTVGAKLVLTSDESQRPYGTLGGGCVEADAILTARTILETGASVIREHQLTEELAWNTGLVCGGSMWILAEPSDRAFICGGRDIVSDVERAAAGGEALAIVSRFRRQGRSLEMHGRMAVRSTGERLGAVDERVVAAALDQISSGGPALLRIEDDEYLIEPIVRRPHLVIAGGGHVARAIARQARLLDFDVTVIEDRPEFADPSRFDGAAVIAGGVPENIATFDYGPASFLVIATRGHKLDADCVLAAARTRVAYIGLLGSRRKTVLITELLAQEGVDPSRIAAVHAPVGLDLGGRTPAEIALSVLAEISQIRHRGTGRPLRDR